ncbi:LysE family translocator [Maritalea sp.]|jgi:threonine/homoserine/homoserine lactone efflux protein|uniref:LysE family translocator n=1 Tax=Maritalea sp. TaxID=2003361 RepID=UPI0039E2FB95
MILLEPSALVAFISACFFLAIVPGPTVTLIVANALARGPIAGLLTVLGAQIAIFLMVIVVALGLQAVIGFMSWAFFWVKLVGAAYLLWIGFKMITNRSGLSFDDKTSVKGVGKSIVQGFVVTMSNPKALLFLGAFLPQFIEPSAAAAPQVIGLGLITMLVFTVFDGIYAVAAGNTRKFLTQQRLSTVNKISGSLLIVGGTWLALQRKV